MFARLGGDEFAIIQENEKNQSEGAIALALKIIGLIEQPFDLNGHRANIGTSIGIAFAPEHGADPETLLKKADLALYATKSAGRNDFRVFEPELTEAADHQKTIETEMREALAQNQFQLYYQSIVDVPKQNAYAVLEAFVRWQHPSRGVLSPDQFLPIAEATGSDAAARRMDSSTGVCGRCGLAFAYRHRRQRDYDVSSARRTCSMSSCAHLLIPVCHRSDWQSKSPRSRSLTPAVSSICKPFVS